MNTTLRFLSFVAVWAMSVTFIACAKKSAEPNALPHETAAWFSGGSDQSSYLMGTDTAVVHSGKQAGYLRSLVSDTTRFGTYMQMIKATPYLGKQVKMTGWIKVDSVSGWAGMWCRVDGKNSQSIDFDNMETTNRAITVPTDWKQYAIVVNVPDYAEGLAYGFLLNARGLMHFDDVRFEIIGPCDTTNIRRENRTDWYKDGPGNLDFEK
jgi:hypothetical protein